MGKILVTIADKSCVRKLHEKNIQLSFLLNVRNETKNNFPCQIALKIITIYAAHFTKNASRNCMVSVICITRFFIRKQ